MRTFATLAAVAVVVTHLLPEALRELGPLSMLLFLAGWFAPALAHFIGQRSTSGRTKHAVLAVVSLAYRTTFGARSAVMRSLGLAAASVVGILLSRIAAASTIEGYSP